jgi:hypothetical protein
MAHMPARVHASEGWKYPSDYGAEADGSTDDSAAIAAADLAARAAGASLFFPPGTYRISSEVTVGSGTRWVAVPGTVTIKHKGSTLHRFIAPVTDKSNIRFEGLTFDGDMSNVSTYAAGRWDRPKAFGFTDCTNVVFENCEFTAHRSPAVYHGGCTRFRVLNCHIHDTDNWGVVGNEATDVDYFDNHVENIYTHGLYCDGSAGTGSLRVRMVKNTAINCAYDATYADSGIGISVHKDGSIVTADVLIMENYVKSCGSMGYSLTPADSTMVGKMVVVGNHCEGHTASTGVGMEIIGQNVLIANNIFKNNGFHITLNGSRHIVVQGNGFISAIGSSQVPLSLRPGSASAHCEDVTYSDNQIYGCASGFETSFTATTSPHRDIVVANNNIKACGYGIRTNVSVTGLSIVGNMINNDVVGVGSNGRGIYLTGGVDVKVSGNHVRPDTVSGTADGIQVGGTLTDAEFTDNTIIGGRYGIHISSGTSTTRLKVGGNTCRSQSTSDRVNWNLITGLTDDGNNSWNYAAAAPASLYWLVGQRVYDTAPAAGGTIGWVCTTAGTPGTWKTFGAIAA